MARTVFPGNVIPEENDHPRNTIFRECDHAGIVFPENVFPGKTIRESNHPGNDRIPYFIFVYAMQV